MEKEVMRKLDEILGYLATPTIATTPKKSRGIAFLPLKVGAQTLYHAPHDWEPTPESKKEAERLGVDWAQIVHSMKYVSRPKHYNDCQKTFETWVALGKKKGYNLAEKETKWKL